MSDLEMHFSEEIYHIDSAVKKSGFPVVIKSENDISTGRKGSHDYYEDGLKLPYRSVTMLERRITLQFAHVTVMEFRDPDKVLSERGIEFVESHSEYEDDDYLLPLMYPGKCKIVHPPGKRKRYVAVSEVIIIQMAFATSNAATSNYSFVCLVLWFYGPANPMGSCRSQSVNLIMLLLGKLSPLSGLPDCAHSFARN